MNTQEIRDVVDSLNQPGDFDAEVTMIESLRGVLQKLTGRSLEFATSLVNQYDNKGSLSDKQMYWVCELYKQTLQAKPEAKEPEVKVPKIQEMFQKAATKLKRMKVELKTVGGERVVFKPAGEHSKYHGSIMVTDGRRFGENQFFGFIDLDGVFHHGKRCNPEVVELVTQFGDDPELVAMQYGRENHVCCFCMRGLTDKRSTDVGYGPVCADRYGLNWG